jgi:nicotinic acid mononucleotide adenylyltransferase
MSAAAPDVIPVAWMGGSFSPPTKAHLQVILAIGNTMRELHPGKLSYVCVVPVSQKYPKKSIQCATIYQRKHIMDAFIKLVQDEAVAMGILTTEVEFKFMVYEMNDKKEGGVKTYDSLKILKDIFEPAYPGKEIKLYIAQGQDNIEKIKDWYMPEEVKKYPMLVFPRGDAAVVQEGLDLTTIKGIPGGFTEGVSSSAVRKLFQAGTVEKANEMLNAEIIRALEEVGNPYKNSECEENDKGGGYRRKTRSKAVRKSRRSRKLRKH